MRNRRCSLAGRNIALVLLEGLRKVEYCDYDSPGIDVAPNDSLLDKLESNLKEAQGRGGELYLLADAASHFPETEQIHVLRLPEHYDDLSPILLVVALRLLTYHTALAKGTDVDKPRSLAKSVTVE